MFYDQNKAKVDTEIKERFQILESQYHLMPQVQKDFFSTPSKINKSELMRIGPITGGALFWLSDEEQEMIRNIEEEHDIKIFHVILAHTNIGTLYSCLYVSQYEEEWDMDKDGLMNTYPFAYVHNADDPICSEFGSIGIKEAHGGLIRTD